MKTILLSGCVFISLILCNQAVYGQQQIHPVSATYEWPADKQVKQKLDQWQDLKFGIILHWGLYAVPGIIESWSICSENWIERDSTVAYNEYKKWYFGQQQYFNPTKFDPEAWAKTAREAGMRYLVFTTKHHDGFCMFDSRQTDFTIARGPFQNNPKADVAKYVFDAFRKNNFMIGAYFSKPDWHSEDYWWPKYATPDRNNNYDIRKYPWRWNRFKNYTYQQIGELMHNYGSVDILWLDGGWVRPRNSVTKEVLSWGAPIPDWSQDIDMPRIASMARSAQPGILVVDRTVHGPYENYQTPEQRIPDHQLDHPWESCMTLAGNWGYVPGDGCKSSTNVIHTLVEVVAKGGNLLLGVGPKPDGTLPEEAIARLHEIGNWLNKNGAAIYATRTTPHYHDGNTWFTQNKNNGMRYAITLIAEKQKIQHEIVWANNIPKPGTAVTLVATGEKISWKREGNRVHLWLPVSVTNSDATYPAFAFSFVADDKQH